MDDFGPQEWLSALRQLESALGPSFERELAPRLRALAAAPAPADPAERLLAALELMDAYVAEQEAHASAATACAPGCPFCCHTHRVLVSELEAVLLVRAVAASPQRKDAVARVQRGRPTTDGPGSSPCAMLGKDGSCSVHRARPSTCRAYLSTSRKACKLYAQGRGPRPDTIRGYPYLAHKMTTAICAREAEDRAGVGGRTYELNGLMRRIFAEPAKIEAWRRGSPTHEPDLVVLTTPAHAPV